MPGQVWNGGGKPYLKIVGGNIAQKVDKDTEGAKKREWKSPDGKTSGISYELNFMNWSGLIQLIVFKNTDFGDVCEIHFNDAILTLPIDSRYFSEFAKKLPNLDLAKSVTLHPYNIEDGVREDGKKKYNTGISIQQNGVKIPSYFYDVEKKESINGFPAVNDAEKENKGYWKNYFGYTVLNFLVNVVKSVAEKMPQKVDRPETTGELPPEPLEPFAENELVPDDLPF